MKGSFRNGVLVLFGVVTVIAVAVPGLCQYCEDCYEKTDCWTRLVGGELVEICWDDASCCLSGGAWCDQMANDPDWFNVLWDSGDCYENSNDNGYFCDGTFYSCDDGGGDGGGGGSGGGSCSIPPGVLCPAECFSCEIIAY